MFVSRISITKDVSGINMYKHFAEMSSFNFIEVSGMLSVDSLLHDCVLFKGCPLTFF